MKFVRKKVRFVDNVLTNSDNIYWICKEDKHFWGIGKDWDSHSQNVEGKAFLTSFKDWKNMRLVVHPFFKKYLK